MAIETEFVFLQPSDVLVVRTTAYMHQGQRDHIVADIKAQLGAGAKVIVLDGGLDLQVLRPAGVAEVQQVEGARAEPEVHTAPGSVIPAYTWMHKAELVGDQLAFAISHDEKLNRYAIRNEDLTVAQRAVHGLPV